MISTMKKDDEYHEIIRKTVFILRECFYKECKKNSSYITTHEELLPNFVIDVLGNFVGFVILKLTDIVTVESNYLSEEDLNESKLLLEAIIEVMKENIDIKKE